MFFCVTAAVFLPLSPLPASGERARVRGPGCTGVDFVSFFLVPCSPYFEDSVSGIISDNCRILSDVLS